MLCCRSGPAGGPVLLARGPWRFAPFQATWPPLLRPAAVAVYCSGSFLWKQILEGKLCRSHLQRRCSRRRRCRRSPCSAKGGFQCVWLLLLGDDGRGCGCFCFLLGSGCSHHLVCTISCDRQQHLRRGMSVTSMLWIGDLQRLPWLCKDCQAHLFSTSVEAAVNILMDVVGDDTSSSTCVEAKAGLDAV